MKLSPIGTKHAHDLLKIADEATEAARNAANVAENYAKVADEATEAASKASAMDKDQNDHQNQSNTGRNT